MNPNPDDLAARTDADLRAIDAGIRELAGVLADTPLSSVPAEALTGALTMVLRARGDRITVPLTASPEWAADPVSGAAELARVRYRRVRLAGEWWKKDAGPLLGLLQVGEEEVRPVALLPVGGGYTIFDPVTRDRTPVDARNADALLDDAITFYRPLPEPAPGFAGLLFWAASPYRKGLAVVFGLMAAMTILGMIVPIAAGWLVDSLIPSADRPGLIWLALALMAIVLGQGVFRLLDALVAVRLQIQVITDLQAAVWDRLLRLPLGFFRRFTPGELLERAMVITALGKAANGSALRSLLGGLFAGVNVMLMAYYAPKVAGWAIAVACLTALITAVVGIAIRRRVMKLAVVEGRVVGFVVGLIHGVSRIRAAGAEGRAFGQWSTRFAEQLRLETRIQRLKDIGTIAAILTAGIGTVVVFAATGAAIGSEPGKLSAGQFVAFLTAYGAFTAGLMGITETLVEVIDGLARQRLAQPILAEPLEPGPSLGDPGALSGTVSVENAVFRYQPNAPAVLAGVTIQAKPGEFVAVVGPSGSGKSTLLRLLVGFDQPEDGRVTYDGFDLKTLHLLAVRRQLGVVLQSAKVFVGTIFDNIAAGHVVNTDEVWEAAKAAAFADELEKLPMKLHTPIADNGANLSGGQRQRLLLARALVHKPRILILDEATSALDNPTQAKVTAALKQRNVTRIVVAHRISTIAAADRIYVMDKGRVVQTGTFAELMAVDGLFRRLAANQFIA